MCRCATNPEPILDQFLHDTSRWTIGPGSFRSATTLGGSPLLSHLPVNQQGIAAKLSKSQTPSSDSPRRPSLAAVASTKRKEEGGSPAGDERSKSPKEDDDEPGPTTPQSKAGKMEGPDDTFIMNLFTPLFYSIITFSLAYFKGAPYVTPRRREQKEFFETLTSSDYKLYLTSKHPGAKERIVQAVVWNKLVEELLRLPLRAYLQFPEGTIKKFVSGKSPPCLSKKQRMLTQTHEDDPQFYAWRTMTARFLHNNYTGPTSWGKGGPRRQEFVNETLDLLFNLSVVEERQTLQNDLEDIAQKAYELATAMARSGAYWVCTMEDPRIKKLHEFRIRTDRMEDVELWDEGEATSRSLTVDLVAAPMLLKFGNSSGENFGTHCVFKKAQVVTKPKKGTS
ncbi:hypothetical protein F5883DRAFT_517926 [Diaporthe sp. PMI_573]|nr:hypothetical protein F5883DRAFT_517926 [Diaporthaceae sp. PMI_573]